MSKEKEIREQFIKCFERAITYSKSGNLLASDSDLEEMDRLVPRGAAETYDDLLQALTFWDEWVDAANHNWHEGLVGIKFSWRGWFKWPLYLHNPYKEISEEDWRVAAELMLHQLRNQMPVSNEFLKQFY